MVYKKGGLEYLKTKVVSVFNEDEVKAGTYKPSPFYHDRVSIFENSPMTEESIVFLGDSLTDANEWAEQLNLSHVLNRGISGDTTQGVLNRLDSLGNPQKIFILIGVNDLINLNSDEATILKNYRSILDKVKSNYPESTVYLQSVLPINTELFVVPQQDINQKILSLNKNLERLSLEMNVQYVDLFSVMQDNEKNLNQKLTNDGLHLNAEGYERWLQTIKPYLN